jgi:hypothetical protein
MKAVVAYLTNDHAGLRAIADLERLETAAAKPLQMGAGTVRSCGAWGNERLAFVLAAAGYDAGDALGQAPVLLGLRQQSGEWRVLVSARDPISTGEFVRKLAAVPLERAASPVGNMLPANMLSPEDGLVPSPLPGQRFGTFGWHASPSSEMVAELAEFAYDDDARLILVSPAAPGAPSAVSAGALWTTSHPWRWRVWSIGRTGEVAFSESRTFVH